MTNSEFVAIPLTENFPLITPGTPIKRVLRQIGDAFKVVYFIFDGELGHNDAMQMVRQVGLHLVSKLRYNSALYFAYDGPYCGRGPRRKYGQKLAYRNMASE